MPATSRAPWARWLALGCVAALPGVPLGASDALLLRAAAGGERRGGAVTSCDDERCFLDQAPVALADLVWIGLGVGEEAPPTGVRERGVVLADGTLRPGHFRGMSLGSVLLEAEELDRAQVRWVRVADVPPPVDVLVRRDGAARAGELAGCSGGSCTMTGEATARAELAWIGLARDPERIETPSAPQDPARDAIQFADGSVRATPLVGVGADDVVVGVGTFPRAQVAWIYLAPPASEPGAPHVRPSPPAGPAPGPPAPPAPPSPPTRPRPSPPGGPPPGAPAPPGAAPCDLQAGMTSGSGVIWTGSARVHQWLRLPNWSEVRVADFEARLREACEMPISDLSATPNRRIGTVVYLDSDGTVERETFADIAPGICVCEGQQEITEPAHLAGTIWRRTAPGDSTAALGFDLPGEPAYQFDLGAWGVVEAPCRGETCDSMILGGTMLSANAGRQPAASVAESWDPEVRSPEGGILRGSYTRQLGPATMEVSWSICRAGVQCPPLPAPADGGAAPPPPPPPEEDSCGDLTQARALVDVLWARRQADAAGLKTEWDVLEAAHREMLFDLEAYRAAIGFCAIWDIVSETLESAAGWAGEFTEFGTKVLSGDLSAFVGDDVWGPLAERAWDAFPRQSTWAGNMHDRISGCGAPLPPDLRAAAHRFVDNWERVRGLMPSVQEKINRIRDQDLRYWEKWQRFYQTCLQWAACKGVPPSSCPQPPEQPSGPMPPAPPSPGP